MSKSSELFALLEAQDEPSRNVYNETVNNIVNVRHHISSLTQEGVRDNVLILLPTHSHRLAHFFRRLRLIARQNTKSQSIYNIAIEIIDLLVNLLPYIHQLLEPDKVLDFLVPGLDVAFAPSQRPALRELASVLANSGTLLEHLVSDRLGNEIIRQWASIQSTFALDAGTSELWTERLLNMMQHCAIDHKIVSEHQQWHMLKALKKSLQNVERSINCERSTPVTRHHLPPLGGMTQLNRDDKKGQLAKHQDANSTAFSLKEDDKRSLEAFDINVPGSKSSLSEVIRRLEGEKTNKSLLSVVSRPPCYVCVSSLDSQSPSFKVRDNDENVQAVSNPHVETLNKGLGLWKVLLSPQALRSVLHMKSHGLDGSVTEKLSEIASGRWNRQSQPRAGKKEKRKCLKVPVAKTSCGRNHFILWQIVIGADAETDLSQQEIKVWEVCEYSKFPKTLDRVIFLQKSYSEETIRRCQQHCSSDDGTQLPARFEYSSSHSADLVRPSTDLDIRTVDQDIIDMTNKFYTLTEPVIRSIISNDLSAEFPFDLSREEARVIRHYRTASLILGRSGTGKTTCLVFKLLGKYLASRAVAGERPVRQILLTRSAFLADKLSSYTQRLIKTLILNSNDVDSSHPSEHTSPITEEEDVSKITVFTLRDTSFPLICTWEGFLEILENTATKLNSQVFHDLGVLDDQREYEVANTRGPLHGRLVDFHAFRVDYWPHFSHALTKELPIHLVFPEIMGVIKGSASSRESLQPLGREEYLKRSYRLAPTFQNEAERSRVYEIFKMYEKMKLELGGVDQVDRVMRLLSAVRQDQSLKQLLRICFDEVYIDEIQDQRCLDVEFLLSFIRDGRGFHFAGDTAQAISQDSTFRFDDIKALFHEHFAAASAATHQAELSRPELFTLSKNYRSHEGILALASHVMGMIWQGFPETVDRLDPEIGHLNGPKPVLFRGVDSDILSSRDVGHSALSAGTADFGAEQVILVRDARIKSSLQDRLGNDALVLTILESKGMEFDDVLLWNFFTECHEQAGLRSLETLAKEPAVFDARKYSGMCSELKHLYVAITRARVQLFIMETSVTTATTVLKFLGHHTPEPLLHVTSPGEEDFAMRLEMLRPGTSLDPRQWARRGAELMHRRMYKDALRCYRKAHDVSGETTAEGHLREEQGRQCKAISDIQGFNQNLTLAVQCFQEVKLMNDAARNLVALGKCEDAAEILFQDRQYSKAALLFADAGLNSRAIDSHHLAGEFIEAAGIMNRDRDYDRLVSYLNENRGNLSATVLERYGLLCKLLLKQNKTSIEYRGHAISLLGSLDEQEKCFRDYGMDVELADLYATQSRHEDLFHLYCKKGLLEQALEVAIMHGLLKYHAGGLQSKILSVLDYVWAGHLEKNLKHQNSSPLELPSGFLTPQALLRAEQWQVISPIYSMEGSVARQHVAGLTSMVPKTIFCLRKFLHATMITQAKNLDDLPFELMREAIDFVRNLVGNNPTDAMRILLLLTGLWKSDITKDQYILLPWSPLRGLLVDMSTVDVKIVAKKYFLDGLVSAVLAMDTAARELWKSKWPPRCVQFLTLGSCPRLRNQEHCNWLHQVVSQQDCSQLIQDLLLLNSIFCSLAGIYYRRILNERFQEQYLRTKRYWLEILARELLHLSSMEQHSAAIIRLQIQLFHDKGLVAVTSFLEELLYHHLNKREWEKRSNFTSLLEHMQLTEAFDFKVQYRNFRALSHRLLTKQRHRLQRHLDLLYLIKQEAGRWNASFYQSSLTTFLNNLDNIEVPALLTFHSLTTVFESFAAYLVLTICTAACVVPNSWIDLHTQSISRVTRLPESLQGDDDRYRYQASLVQLAKGFCRLLRRLNNAGLSNDSLLCSGTPHKSLLLRQRNAELVAIIVANLATASPGPPIGFNEIWSMAREVFEYEVIKAFHLRSLTATELIQRLVPSLARYNGKDALVVVIKDRKKGLAFSNLEDLPGVKTIPFDQLCPPKSAATTNSANQEVQPASDDDALVTHDQYSAAETKAAITIQSAWRSISFKIKKRRSYVSVPENRATVRFFKLGAQCATAVTSGDQKAICKLLVMRGVALSLKLDTATSLLSNLQEDVMTCIENVDLDQETDKSVDDILSGKNNVEALLDKAEQKLSDESISEAVKMGMLPELEKAMKDIEEIILEAEQAMLSTRKMIEELSVT